MADPDTDPIDSKQTERPTNGERAVPHADISPIDGYVVKVDNAIRIAIRKIVTLNRYMEGLRARIFLFCDIPR